MNPTITTIDFFKNIIAPINNPRVAEIGIHLGDTSLAFAQIMNGKGELHLFDFEGITDKARQKIEQAGYLNVYIHSNSRKVRDSYNWSLMQILKKSNSLRFDYIYLDGAHTWEIDGFAFFLCDLLLEIGGYIDFDDYNWSHALSPTCNPQKYPKILDLYPEEQIMTPQVKLVVDLLVRKTGRYKELVPNKIFQKIAHSFSSMDN
ncbi:MAG: class I SAM-dependent methyltransferase [Negativicutes bacterium]|nr:class I SAM-dependent methyltransferase [Negativicutes bacterium]